jgi:hypothetical protein
MCESSLSKIIYGDSRHLSMANARYFFGRKKERPGERIPGPTSGTREAVRPSAPRQPHARCVKNLTLGVE